MSSHLPKRLRLMLSAVGSTITVSGIAAICAGGIATLFWEYVVDPGTAPFVYCLSAGGGLVTAAYLMQRRVRRELNSH